MLSREFEIGFDPSPRGLIRVASLPRMRSSSVLNFVAGAEIGIRGFSLTTVESCGCQDCRRTRSRNPALKHLEAAAFNVSELGI